VQLRGEKLLLGSFSFLCFCIFCLALVAARGFENLNVPASCVAVMEEVGLSKFYENTHEQRVCISRRMHRAPFSKFRIPTTLHHRLAG
jgi:hypothetical protein